MPYGAVFYMRCIVSSEVSYKTITIKGKHLKNVSPVSVYGWRKSTDNWEPMFFRLDLRMMVYKPRF
jgi:hypothetical protein